MSTHSSSYDSRVKEQLEAIRTLQTQNVEQERKNEEYRFRTQTLEAREKHLQEQLMDTQRFPNVFKTTRTLMRIVQPLSAEIQVVETPPKSWDPQSYVNVIQTRASTGYGSKAINSKIFAETMAKLTLKWFEIHGWISSFLQLKIIVAYN